MNTTKPLKVLHVLHSLSMGGAETWLMELLRHWSQTGAVEMHFLATGGITGVFDEEVAGLGGRIHYLRYGRDALGTFLRGYRSILARENFDAIHDHSDLASGWHFLLGLGSLPPVRVAHVHNPIMHLRANYAVTPMRRFITALGRVLVMRLATHVCGTSSKSLIEYGFKVQAKRPAVSVLHCGFDIAKFNSSRKGDRVSVLRELGLPAQAKMVLFAGRLDKDLEIAHPRNHKNSWLAVLIGRVAAEKNPDVHLVMAGAGNSQRTEIERRVAEWGFSSRIHLLGVRKDMGRLMRAADAFLFPSADEGLGMVAVEAQAAGTPVLASTAIPDEAVVVPQIFRRVPLVETPEVWADALNFLLLAPRPDPTSLYATLQRSAFSIQISARRLEAVYRNTDIEDITLVSGRGIADSTQINLVPPAGTTPLSPVGNGVTEAKGVEK